MAGIVGWQARFVANHDALDKTYRLTASRGLFDVRDFFYAYYYLGRYPVTVGATMASATPETPFELLWHAERPPEFSREGTERFLREHGSNLIMDMNWTFHSGERGRIFLFWPDTLLKGAPRDPSVRPCHVIVFIIALCALFVAFWAVRQPVLGTAMTLLLGSNPFQLYSAYGDENVFSWPISTAMLVLALHLPLLRADRLPRLSLWLVPLLTGVLVATVETIRTEPVPIMASAALTYLFLGRAVPRRPRLVALALLICSYGAMTASWDAYFFLKFHEAKRWVAALGGRPMPEDHFPLRHRVWHSMWCGLGDFDVKYGHLFDDRLAFHLAFRILESKYHLDVPHLKPTGYFFDDAFWDEKKTYAKTGDELPHYYDVIRDDLLEQITRDPGWYAYILKRRAWRLLSEATPIQVALDPWLRLTVPFHGLILLPLLLGLIATRNWMRVKLALFTLPLCLPALVIYSGLGMHLYACYHMVAAAILLALPVEALLRWHSRRRKNSSRYYE